jgi:glucose/arabinose dehydrogenase
VVYAQTIGHVAGIAQSADPLRAGLGGADETVVMDNGRGLINPGVRSIRSRQGLRRGFKVLGLMIIAALVLICVLNVGGWRALLIARVLRTNNYPSVVPRPPNFQPQVPSGFVVTVFATGFVEPRWLAVAPNGDVFVADSAIGQVVVLHDPQGGRPESREIFADHLNLPFGIAFHDQYVYVANTNEVLRFPYDPRTSQRLGDAEHVLGLPGMGYHQHWTRSLAFSPNGQRLFVSVGSSDNISIESDARRAAILVCDPDGKNVRLFAGGLRNAVGIGFNQESGNLWATVNERDDLGEDVPSDYFAHIVDGGFYGFPYSYIGGHVDNRVAPRPDLVAQAVIPDLLIGPHVAPLQFAFYQGEQFPSFYWHGAFIAEHGSWNRRIRSGYQVIFIPFRNGLPAGEPTPFFSGFVPDPTGKIVYGRPVGVAEERDGSVLISDDAGKLIWRVSYKPESGPLN